MGSWMSDMERDWAERAVGALSGIAAAGLVLAAVGMMLAGWLIRAA